MLIERRQTLPGLLAVLDDHRQDQVRLGREMVMDAGFADMNPFGHIGIAEPVITTGGEQLLGLLDDLNGSGGELQTHRNMPWCTERNVKNPFASCSGRVSPAFAGAANLLVGRFHVNLNHNVIRGRCLVGRNR
ncbi:hypothetical protein D3C87_1492190 [compost metagenome]